MSVCQKSFDFVHPNGQICLQNDTSTFDFPFLDL